MFAHQVRITTALEKRPGGDSYNVRLEPLHPASEVDGVWRPAILNSMIGVTNPLFLDAKRFLESYSAGSVKVDYETTAQEPELQRSTAVEDNDRNVPW